MAITERETGQIDEANASGRPAVVLIHNVNEGVGLPHSLIHLSREGLSKASAQQVCRSVNR